MSVLGVAIVSAPVSGDPSNVRSPKSKGKQSFLRLYHKPKLVDKGVYTGTSWYPSLVTSTFITIATPFRSGFSGSLAKFVLVLVHIEYGNLGLVPKDG